MSIDREILESRGWVFHLGPYENPSIKKNKVIYTAENGLNVISKRQSKEGLFNWLRFEKRDVKRDKFVGAYLSLVDAISNENRIPRNSLYAVSCAINPDTIGFVDIWDWKTGAESEFWDKYRGVELGATNEQAAQIQYAFHGGTNKATDTTQVVGIYSLLHGIEFEKTSRIWKVTILLLKEGLQFRDALYSACAIDGSHIAHVMRSFMYFFQPNDWDCLEKWMDTYYELPE